MQGDPWAVDQNGDRQAPQRPPEHTVWHVFRITPDGERIDLLEPSEYGFDGVVSLAERGVLVSSWDWSAIFLVGVDGTFSTVVEDVEAPADIGYDATRNRLLIPLFRRDEIMIREVR